MNSELVLVVCAANVCRSPMAELLLRRGLEGVPGAWAASAGTLARQDDEICSVVGAWGADEAWRAAADAHRARRAVPELLEQAALILVSSRDVRADVVLAAPEVRGRTYTLREAAHLGEGFDATSQPRHVGVIARYATHLDRARVVRGAIPDGHRLWRRGRRADGSDITDGHGRSRRGHRAALNEVLGATADVVRQLGGQIA